MSCQTHHICDCLEEKMKRMEERIIWHKVLFTKIIKRLDENEYPKTIQAIKVVLAQDDEAAEK